MQNIKIGCIGLGLMGRPIALNLMKAGYSLSAFARRPETLASLNMTAYSSPRELASHCDVIITNVSDTVDVEEVILGTHGIIEGANPASLVIDMSTISPDRTRHIASELANKKIDMLDAPVSGGPQGAQSATLSIMVGGKKAIFDKTLPLLQTIGQNIVYMGDHGAGQVTKACNQLVVAQTMTAIAEAFVFAQKSSVSPSKVREALLGGFAGSRILDVHGQRMLSGDYTPGFKSKLHQKDLAIVCQEADKLGIELKGTQLTQEYMNQINDNELDSSAIFTVISKD